jgi:hypothetical protein
MNAFNSARPRLGESFGLPEPRDLFLAISGHSISGLPLEKWARELGDLYAELISAKVGRSPMRGQFDYAQALSGIDQTVLEINAWAALNVPQAKSGRKHTHSLGDVIGYLAKTYAEAWWTVLHSSDGAIRHQAWYHLGEAREGYAEMVQEVRSRHLRLPLGWSALGRGMR